MAARCAVEEACRGPDLNLNIWLIVNQGGFGTET